MSITIRDVARKAGVSVTTVSRTLNNRGYISKETREKIYAVIQELNYSPNMLARSLTRARTQTIGLIVPSINHPFFAQIAQQIEHRFFDLGYQVLLRTTEANVGHESRILDLLQQARVDGIIIGSPGLSDQDYAKSTVPIISFDTHLASASVSIAANHALGGRMAAQALLRGGCRRVLQIVGDFSAKTDAAKRHQTFLEEMIAAGCECISLPSANHFADLHSSREMIEKVFDQYPGTDAFFATDINAAELLNCATRRGLSVPQDIQIIAYDGTDVLTVLCPQLTVIRQPFEELAEKTVDSMVKLLQGEKVESRIRLDSLTLIQGISTRV